MRFDWPKFLRDHHIPYVTTGPNVSRGNINLRCPFCGENDPSEHMGAGARGWGCLRNSAHRGKNPARLIQQLLHCSSEEATRLAGGTGAVAPSQDELAQSFASLKQAFGAPKPIQQKPLTLPPEFKSLSNGSPLSGPFLMYLENRGFRLNQVLHLAKIYNLQYATKGSFAGRLILPIYDRYGQLLSWTGRAISKDVIPRYKTLRMSDPDGDGGPVARLAINHTVLGLPALYEASPAKALIVVEGPLDALKITAFGRALGVWGTCLFGLNAYPEQAGELLELALRFDKLGLLLDPDAVFQRMRITKQLIPLDLLPLTTPEGAEDPGAMTGGQVTEMCLALS